MHIICSQREKQVDFDEYDAIAAAIQERKDKINAVADRIIEKNMEAFTELAK